MGETSISWTDETWNPFVGCSIISPGCTNCYAMRMSHRLQAAGVSHYQGVVETVKDRPIFTGRIGIAPDRKFFEPVRKTRPRLYFVNSMSDMFHENVSDAMIDRAFAVMALSPQHEFQVLTKRSARMRAYLNDLGTPRRVWETVCDLVFDFPGIVLIADPSFDVVAPKGRRVHVGVWPLKNVWIGVTAERQQEYDERSVDLEAALAAVKFFSYEPLIGPITPGYLGDWGIVGGESGPGSRPMDPIWPRHLRDAYVLNGVPFHFKQHGDYLWWVDDNGEIRPEVHKAYVFDQGMPHQRTVYRIGKSRSGRTLDGKVHDEFPKTGITR